MMRQPGFSAPYPHNDPRAGTQAAVKVGGAGTGSSKRQLFRDCRAGLHAEGSTAPSFLKTGSGSHPGHFRGF